MLFLLPSAISMIFVFLVLPGCTTWFKTLYLNVQKYSFYLQVNVTIMRKGCHPQTITNKFCYGVCHSFYIPKDREVTKVQDACVPTDTVKQQVTLNCLKKKKKSTKGRKKRRSGWRKKSVTVEKVLNCGCSRI